ncbi:MAG: flavodoxin family protein [Nitrosopumilus sp.]|nr:flavodoxin family protein [Nitrosopumilus sp.]MBA3550900.1 flavodoxin family protein [Patescibacteria group bacterium]
MKALILQATLKKKGQSNTQVLSEFFAEKLEKMNVVTEIVKLVDYTILPGTYSDMGGDDEWPQILKKILAADIVIFSTPIWWDNHSSLMQRVIERLDEIHDEILSGKKSRLDGKVGGVIVTGDSDGAEYIVGNISNFFNNIGIAMPPYCNLTVLWRGQSKGEKTTREELMRKYKKEYSKAAETMASQLIKFSTMVSLQE